jgi:ABC-2 type transport system ATP-binding protein
MANIVLEAKNLSKKYKDCQAVRDLSLAVEEGEVFGFLGPNGAGKTTTINMLCGLLPPDAGTVCLHGKPIDRGNDHLKALVGVCPQNIVLWEKLTCLEQLMFIGQLYGLPARTVRENANRLLADLDLEEKRNKLAGTLSGGMQRRMNIAMALVHDPQIVVLDEPEAGLDPQSRVKVREYIQSLAHRKTVILTTHNMDEADRVADRVAIIDHGQLLVLDTPQALRAQVGAGDILEIGIAGQVPADFSGKATLGDLAAETHWDPQAGCLQIRALGGATHLPAILERLEGAGLQPRDVQIRQNTLEDVFIQLTGRRLRE